MRVLLHICFCLNYKAGLINDKEKHRSTTLRRSPYWASSWPHIARPQVFHVIGELASHHPLLSSPMTASLWGLHYLLVVVIAPFTILSAVFTTQFQLFSTVWGKNSVVRYVSRSCISKTLIDELLGELLEIPDEILQVSEELQTQIFSNFITSSCKFQISSSHRVLCWGSTCPHSVHTVTSSWRSRVKTLLNT